MLGIQLSKNIKGSKKPLHLYKGKKWGVYNQKYEILLKIFKHKGDDLDFLTAYLSYPIFIYLFSSFYQKSIVSHIFIMDEYIYIFSFVCQVCYLNNK